MPSASDDMDVWLHRYDLDPVYVGRLTQDDRENVRFDVDRSYIDLGPNRPVVSVGWTGISHDEDKAVERLLSDYDKVALRGNLPPFFSNLLPEGALRTLVEGQLGTGRHTEFDIIRHLGADLPGAVKVLPEGSDPREYEDAAYQDFPIASTSRITASLPGMQMKISAMVDRRLSFPAGREDVDHGMVSVIAKPPAELLPGLPENEFTCMKLAEVAGVNIANVQLLPGDLVEGVSEKYVKKDEPVLVVDRFDRSKSGRIHMEEFAQSFGAPGNQKYTMANGETILRVVDLFAGRHFLKEAVIRTVVNLLLGNGDAHLKNWAYLFNLPEQPDLSPAYDIVSTAAYNPADKMAQKFGGTVDPERIGMKKFRQAASFLKLDPGDMDKWVTETVEKAFDLWPTALADLPMLPEQKEALARHWKRVRLTEELNRPVLTIGASVACGM